MPAVLDIQNLKKCFGRFTAVDTLNFQVEEGSFFSILGPSGCGKTTLLRMIAGFIEPTEGKLLIRGRDMRQVPPNRRPVNLVFQNLALFPMMNVFENIAFGLKRQGVAAAETRRRVDAMLERVHLSAFGQKNIDQLWPEESDQYTRLFAMGIDAYNLIPHLNHLKSYSYERYNGETGILSLDEYHRIFRQLSWARFRNGIPRPL